MSNRNRKSGKEKSAWQYYEVLPVGGLHLPLTSRKHRRSKQRNVGFAFLHFLCAKCLMECRVCWCWTKKKQPPIRVILLSHLPPEHVCAFVSNAGNGRRARREQGTVVQRSKPHMFFVSYMCFLSQLCLNPLVHTETRGEKKTHPSPLWRRRAAKGWVLDFFFPKIGTHALYVWYCLHAFPPIAWAGPAWRAGRKTAVRQPLMFLFYGPMSTHCLLSPFVVPLPN